MPASSSLKTDKLLYGFPVGKVMLLAFNVLIIFITFAAYGNNIAFLRILKRHLRQVKDGAFCYRCKGDFPAFR